jgi:uncharacterized protein (TIGR03437 family)
VSAPLEQVDDAGRPYVFRSWSNGGDATQDVEITAEHLQSGLRLIAAYDLRGRVIVESRPAGVAAVVDGEACITPCIADRTLGSQVAVSVPASVTLEDGSRLDFVAWADGQSRERVAVVGRDPQTLVAEYQRLVPLSAEVSPPGSATLYFEPSRPDGYFPFNSRVAVVVQPAEGYRFKKWEGDVLGPYHPAVLTMDQPHSVTAILKQEGPGDTTAVVWNAAGPTPEELVAPGSIISIYGEDLAAEVRAAEANPLPQALGGATVMLEGKMLGLLYVSPEQINAQLPRVLDPGMHKLEIVREGKPSVTAEFNAGPNAPGLFTWSDESGVQALAFHEDGTLVTPQQPARRGETITLLGTGFGPLEGVLPDGFIAPAEPPIPVACKAEVLAGELRIEPAWTGAAPGYVGLVSTRLRVPEEAPAEGPLRLKVSVEQHVSNEAVLPVK